MADSHVSSRAQLAARVKPLPADLTEPQPLVARFRERRNGVLNEADRMVLHAPGFAEGWIAMADAVRSGLTLPARMRTLVICAVGSLTGAEYQVSKHAPAFLEAGGSRAQLATLATLGAWLDEAAPFDAGERAILRLTLEMTRTVAVSDETFEVARVAVEDDRQLVELIGLISFYNMVSRFLIALEVREEHQDAGE